MRDLEDWKRYVMKLVSGIGFEWAGKGDIWVMVGSDCVMCEYLFLRGREPSELDESHRTGLTNHEFRSRT